MDQLRIINSLFSLDECEKFVTESAHNSCWEAAKVAEPRRGIYGRGTKDEKVRKAFVLDGTKCPDLIESLEVLINERVCLSNLFEAPPSDLGLFGSQIIMYPTGGFYKTHSDATYNSKRIYTVLVYLNDNFDGGETFFPGLDIKTLPAAGDAVIFPSTLLHAACSTRSGNKTVFVTWFCRDFFPNWI